MGGFITQALAERFPKLIKSAAPICTAAGNVNAELTYAQDLLWGMKTFFDPSITVSGYADEPTSVSALRAGIALIVAGITEVAGHVFELSVSRIVVPMWVRTAITF